MRYENVRVPADHMLGPRGGAFVVAQTRLGGGRIHHAMRTVGLVRRIFDMLCERAVSRHTQGDMLGDKQLVQQMVADSWMEIEAFRLLTLQTAWKIDQHNDYKAVRADISAVKAMMQKVLHDVSARALQLHGSLGTTHEMPFVQHLVESFVLGLADGPTEVHKVTLARLLLKDHKPAPDVFRPSTCCGCARRRKPSSPTSSPAFRGANRAAPMPAKAGAATPAPSPPSPGSRRDAAPVVLDDQRPRRRGLEATPALGTNADRGTSRPSVFAVDRGELCRRRGHAGVRRWSAGRSADRS